MDYELQSKIAGQIRTVLVFIAGILISRKLVDEATMGTIIQILMGLVPVGVAFWSWRQKKQAAEIVKAGIASPSTVTVNQVAAEVKSS